MLVFKEIFVTCSSSFMLSVGVVVSLGLLHLIAGVSPIGDHSRKIALLAMKSKHRLEMFRTEDDIPLLLVIPLKKITKITT